MVGEIHKLAGRYKADKYLASWTDLWAEYTDETQKESEY